MRHRFSKKYLVSAAFCKSLFYSLLLSLSLTVFTLFPLPDLELESEQREAGGDVGAEMSVEQEPEEVMVLDIEEESTDGKFEYFSVVRL